MHQDVCDRHVARLADELRALGLVGFRCKGRVEAPTATTQHVWWVRVTVRVGEHELDLHGPASDWDGPTFARVCARTLTRLFRSPMGVEARADVLRDRLDPVDFDAFVVAVKRHGSGRPRQGQGRDRPLAG